MTKAEHARCGGAGHNKQRVVFCTAISLSRRGAAAGHQPVLPAPLAQIQAPGAGQHDLVPSPPPCLLTAHLVGALGYNSHLSYL